MENKEITIYELMGLIKYSKAPRQIKYDDNIFNFDFETNNYRDNKGSFLFGDYIYGQLNLNDTVEILPEQNDYEWEDIEEIEHKGKQIYNTETKSYNTLNSKEKNIFIPIINQLIKNQRKIIEKLESKNEK